MTTELIQLVNDFLEFNKTREEKTKLKDFLVDELNYSDDEAENIENIYNLQMKYS